MSNEKLNYFLMTSSKYFPPSALPALKQQLEGLTDEQLLAVQATEFRDPTMIFLLSLFLCGVDRILIGDVGIGILKILTAGGCGIWWLVDLFYITDAARQYNLNKLNETLMYCK